MSEFEPKFETGKESQLEAEKLEKLSEKNLERLREAAEKAEAREAKKDSLEDLIERVEKARADKEPLKQNQETTPNEAVLHTGTKLKSHALKQTIKRTQKELPAHERAFSKLIHNPAVEAVSDVSGATVARPSGLLAGGLFSVISSLLVLYICRHYGYEYNFLVGIVSFAGGFAVGLLLEGTAKLLRR